jgi:hypothetical protein
MSERAALAGNKAGPHTLEHNGKVYEIRPALTDGVMLAFECARYETANRAIYAQKEYLPTDAYLERLDEVRKRFEEGEFSFESPKSMEFLKTQPGAILLVRCLCDCSEAEVLDLFLNKKDEVLHILKTVMAVSMPKRTGDPKRRARR